MPSWIALLRAVNLGGSTTLPMAELRAVAEGIGFARARTFIASGNLLFDADGDEAGVKALLEAAIAARWGRRIPVLVRTPAEMAAVRDACPFADAPGNRVLVTFLDEPPPADLAIRHQGPGEAVAAGLREVYVRYDQGMARSKLTLGISGVGTARNMNTVARLAVL
jgi:uncharacterized protein (DUF1697 family)